MSRHSLLLALAVLVGLASGARSATVHVPGDQPTIQAGIDAAAVGDTVLVAPGTYVGTGNKNLDLHGKNIVLSAESLLNPTTIDCEGTGRGFFLTAGLTPAAVIDGFTIKNGNTGAAPEGGGGMIVLGSSPRITNCTFADNWANSASNTGGGGAIALYSSTTVIEHCNFLRNESRGVGALGGAVIGHVSNFDVNDCTFTENAAVGPITLGGAIYKTFPSLVRVNRCVFTGNKASFGGAIAMSFEAIIDGCIFVGNRGGQGGAAQGFRFKIINSDFQDNIATTQGGGARLQECTVDRCTFMHNSAPEGGGVYEARSDIRNCVMAANSADRGGGLYAFRGLTIECTMALNTAPVGSGVLSANAVLDRSIVAFNGPGEAITCEELAQATLTCCDVFENAGGDWTGCIASQAGINGNLALDPLFCDRLQEDFHLCSGSPCEPGQSAQCGLIGALAIGCGNCGATAIEATTWGRIKAEFPTRR